VYGQAITALASAFIGLRVLCSRMIQTGGITCLNLILVPNHRYFRSNDRCPKCQGRMMLAGIEPGPAGSDLRTFECLKCEYVLRTMVEEPKKSDKAGWQDSELKPPK
jgi:ssDNA-binding Zn-finger/Zn-ribbon topoisomerase 1